MDRAEALIRSHFLAATERGAAGCEGGLRRAGEAGQGADEAAGLPGRR